MWSAKRSLLLSKVCTLLFGAALLAAAVSGPWLAWWIIRNSPNANSGHFWFFQATFYTGVLPAALLLWRLYSLLNNIGKGQVFVEKNASHMRAISWCCFAGAIICAVSMLYYLPWALVALPAAFVGLIVRVVKNVVQQAIALKEENDLTV